ncbi:unnamed protein product [Arabidopsis halleri]
MAEQIRREIATMKLIKHPNVVQLYEVMARKTKIFIILEYVTGGELSDKIVNDGRMKENEARRYFQQLIHAVDYPHSRGVYHRDLKSGYLGPLTRAKAKKALAHNSLVSKTNDPMGEGGLSTSQFEQLKQMISTEMNKKIVPQQTAMGELKDASTAQLKDEEVINKIQLLAFVFGVDAGEEEREAASVSKLQRKNDISEGGIMSREQHSTHSGGPWAKRAEGKERWHRLTDGGGGWTVRQIGHISEEDKPGSWMGDSKMELSTYDGSTNAIEWLQKCEDYFDDQGIYNDDTKVRQATFILAGKAYYYRLGWEEFKKICKSRLTDSLRKEVEYLRPEIKAMEYARDNECKSEGDKRVRTFGGHTAPTACYSAPISKPMLSGYRGS